MKSSLTPRFPFYTHTHMQRVVHTRFPLPLICLPFSLHRAYKAWYRFSLFHTHTRYFLFSLSFLFYSLALQLMSYLLLLSHSPSPLLYSLFFFFFSLRLPFISGVSVLPSVVSISERLKEQRREEAAIALTGALHAYPHNVEVLYVH